MAPSNEFGDQDVVPEVNILTPGGGCDFMTGHGDIQMAAKAMKAGAIEFLEKPFRDEEVLDAVRLGFEQDRTRRARDRATDDVRSKFATLTPREQKVMAFVAAGLMNSKLLGKWVCLRLP